MDETNVEAKVRQGLSSLQLIVQKVQGEHREAICWIVTISILVIMINWMMLYAVYLTIAWRIWRVFSGRFLSHDLQQEVVCIGGGAGRMGRELAHVFMQKGCKVVLLDWNGEGLYNLEKELSALHGGNRRIITMNVDLTSKEHVFEASEKVLQIFGPISVLINVASFKHGYSFSDCPPDLFVQGMHVNAMSRYWLCLAFMDHLVGRNRGCLVQICHQKALLNSSGLIDFSTSSAAGMAFVNSIEVELKALRRNVRVLTCTVSVEHDMRHFLENPTPVTKSFIPTVSHNQVALRVARAIECGDRSIYVPFSLSLFRLLECFPHPVYDLLMRLTKFNSYRTLN